MFLYCYGSRDACATARTSSSGWRNAVAASGVGRFRFVERRYIFLCALRWAQNQQKNNTRHPDHSCAVSDFFRGRLRGTLSCLSFVLFLDDLCLQHASGERLRLLRRICLSGGMSVILKMAMNESFLRVGSFQESVEPVYRTGLSVSITTRFVMLLSQQLIDSLKREGMVRVLNK